ncbi:hypothetical protein DFJ43DRAFT_1151364 [Lentinula guzmanii]|uniref:Uncharacterized protein n=1 Tax=Lentinula guzmanii TaxID=2804957 RepID=A0AA38JQF6_9AGAR|nr:hypothetical protein DFJ43DRAFT_1151364 [Lentinula guzmanii]
MRVFCELFLLVTLAVHVSSQSTAYHDSGRYKRSGQDIPLSDLSRPSSPSNHPSAQQADHPPSYHEATNSNTAHPAEPPPPYSAVANNRGPNMYGFGQSVPYTQSVPNSNAMQAHPQESGLGHVPAGCEYIVVGVCLMLTPVVVMAATGKFSRELPEKPKRCDCSKAINKPPQSGKLGKRDAAKAFSQRRILSWSEDDLD